MNDVTHEVVSRCLSLIPLIREHQGISLDELSRLARIPKEQIADELGGVLLMCGVPPYFPHNYISFSIDESRVQIRFADHFRRPISLNPLEALALKLACESIAPPGKVVPKVVSTLLRKVEAAMSPEQRRQFMNLARRLIVREPVEVAAGLTGRLALAVAERKCVHLDYLATGKDSSKERLVHPYGLLAREGHWYLIAHDASHGRVIQFRVDRVRRMQVADERFEIAAGFRLDDFAKGLQTAEADDRPRAKIRFIGAGARWLRETAMGGTLREEGQAVLWEPNIGSEESLVRYVLGFGEDAEVLAPPSLRDRVHRALSSLFAAHSAT